MIFENSAQNQILWTKKKQLNRNEFINAWIFLYPNVKRRWTILESYADDMWPDNLTYVVSRNLDFIWNILLLNT